VFAGFPKAEAGMIMIVWVFHGVHRL
jgi:hypothetical protein